MVSEPGAGSHTDPLSLSSPQPPSCKGDGARPLPPEGTAQGPAGASVQVLPAGRPGWAKRKGRRPAGGLPAAGPMNTQCPSSRAGSEAQGTGSPPPSRWLQHASSRVSQNWRQGGGAAGPGPQGGASSRQKNQARKRWQRVWRSAPQARAAACTSSPLPWCRWLGSQTRPMPRRLQIAREGGRGRQRPVAPSCAEV